MRASAPKCDRYPQAGRSKRRVSDPAVDRNGRTGDVAGPFGGQIRDEIAQFAPSSANERTQARPGPLVDAETRTVFPSSLRSIPTLGGRIV